MISHHLSPGRAMLPILTCVFLCGAIAPRAGRAVTPYERTDQSEGDPGDGVLSPLVDRNTGGGLGSNSDGPRQGRRNAVWRLPSATDLFAVYFPGLGVIAFPWPHATFCHLTLSCHDRRWHNAP